MFHLIFYMFIVFIHAMTLNSFNSLLHFAIVSLCSSVCAFFASVKAAGNIFGSGVITINAVLEKANKKWGCLGAKAISDCESLLNDV